MSLWRVLSTLSTGERGFLVCSAALHEYRAEMVLIAIEACVECELHTTDHVDMHLLIAAIAALCSQWLDVVC